MLRDILSRGVVLRLIEEKNTGGLNQPIIEAQAGPLLL